MDVSQAEQYRDDLTKQFSPISVYVLGGTYDPRMLEHMASNTTVTSYSSLISQARQQLTWLLKELGSQANATSS
jgi:ribosome-binding protein aMBF1 (putative translation factor)